MVTMHAMGLMNTLNNTEKIEGSAQPEQHDVEQGNEGHSKSCSAFVVRLTCIQPESLQR